MESLLLKLSDIDRKIGELLQANEINSQEITQLVDERDQLLHTLVEYASKNEQFAKSRPWQDAIMSTKQLVSLMTTETNKIAQELRKFRLGKKSVQQYKKFL